MSAFLPQELIRKKRDGGVLGREEINSFVQGLVTGEVSESQASAFAMAVFFRGLDAVEQAALTQAMTNSGTVLDWASRGFTSGVVDKHSTGGVGDKVSLMLAPIVAACGAKVPMISGRGLGHTGGTLDKLNAIPGYDVAPGFDRFAEVVEQAGCAIIGQTRDLAPADKRLYAIRDVTGTVESIHLITASILSKKLASGLHGLVMDVKVGNGAFMASHEEAQKLAQNLVKVAGEAGLPTTAILTDMNQVLGTTVGNALEVQETVDYLKGTQREPRLHEVVIELAAYMLLHGGQAENVEAGREMAQNALDDHSALAHFAQMVTLLGGPQDFVERPEGYLEKAPVIGAVKAPKSGYITAMDTRAIGVAVVALGGGRVRTEDDIDYAVGYSDVQPLGTRVEEGGTIATVHARNAADFEQAAQALVSALTIGDKAPQETPVCLETLSSD